MYYSRPRRRINSNTTNDETDARDSITSSAQSSSAVLLYNGTLPSRLVTHVRVHPRLERLPYHAFRACKQLVHLQLQDSTALREIGMGALEGCVSLQTLELPDSLQIIGNEAFVDCTALTQLEFPDSVTTLGEYALKNATALRRVRLPANPEFEWKAIGLCAGCTSLTQVILPPGLTRVAGSSFKLCKSLAQIRIPASVQAIDQWAFLNCQLLVQVDFGGNDDHDDDNDSSLCPQLRTLGPNVFNNCSALQRIRLPASLESIGDRCFFYCTSLAVVQLPNSSQLTTIGDMAFRLCPSLFSIGPLPASWTTAQRNAVLDRINHVDNVHQFTHIGMNAQGERGLLQPLLILLWPRLLQQQPSNNNQRRSRIWSGVDLLGRTRETSPSTRASVIFQLLKTNIEELVLLAAVAV